MYCPITKSILCKWNALPELIGVQYPPAKWWQRAAISRNCWSLLDFIYNETDSDLFWEIFLSE